MPQGQPDPTFDALPAGPRMARVRETRVCRVPRPGERVEKIARCHAHSATPTRGQSSKIGPFLAPRPARLRLSLRSGKTRPGPQSLRKKFSSGGSKNGRATPTFHLADAGAKIMFLQTGIFFLLGSSWREGLEYVQKIFGENLTRGGRVIERRSRPRPFLPKSNRGDDSFFEGEDDVLECWTMGRHL